MDEFSSVKCSTVYLPQTLEHYVTSCERTNEAVYRCSVDGTTCQGIGLLADNNERLCT